MPAARDLLKLLPTWHGVGHVVSRRPSWRLAVFAAVALCAAYMLLSTAPALNEFRDAHVLGHYETVARDAIVRWHQMPLWDPYYCGGMYLLGTPQARFTAPTFLLTLLFGEPRGEALAAFAMMIVGLEGAFRYARARGASSLGALLGAPVFALSGIFALSPSLGWIGFFGFELLPWIALGARGALRGEVSGIVIAAASMAWCVGMGGTYAAPIAALWAGFEAAEYVVSRARRRKAARMAVGLACALCAALLAAGAAAIRLWPIADTLAGAPRIIGGTPSNEWLVLAKMLFAGPQNETENGSFFIGLLAVPALLCGLPRRRSLAMVVAAGLCVWLAAGYAVKPSLFAALREMPLYTALRYPERFLIPFALAVAVLGARGVSLLEARARLARRRGQQKRGRILRGLLAVACVGLLADAGPLVRQHALHALDRQLSPAPTGDASRAFHQARGDRWELAYFEPMQRGSLSCWEAYPVPQSPLLRGDLQNEANVTDPGAGTVTELSWSPNVIELAVDLSRPATVAVNQNYHPGWRASVGEIKPMRGLLTVEMPAGKQTLKLRFLPRSATGGALCSLSAVAGLIVLAGRSRRMRGLGPRAGAWLAGAALTPLIPFVLVRALTHEARITEPEMAQDGRPVVVDDLPATSTPLGARFEAGVVLEGVRVSNPRPSAGTDLVLELDWRRDAVIEKGLGIFMHLVPSEGKGMNGDHVLLSSVLDLEDAPADKTLRDVMPLWVPEDSAGKTWKIYVGLWRVRRGGQRVHIVDPARATIDADRVLALTLDVR